MEFFLQEVGVKVFFQENEKATQFNEDNELSTNYQAFEKACNE